MNLQRQCNLFAFKGTKTGNFLILNTLSGIFYNLAFRGTFFLLDELRNYQAVRANALAAAVRRSKPDHHAWRRSTKAQPEDW
jgi:hypothetical protein